MNFFLTTNWKTTLLGLCAGLPQIAAAIWPTIPPEAAQWVTGISVVLLGILAKDGNVTGTGT
jgi:hypothetical protein